jgi:hypothetical protein
MHTIHVDSRRKYDKTLRKLYPDARLLDVTSKADAPWIKFSPFYPHGDIPVPFSEGVTAQSVEGIWQGLKVFESTGIDTSKFDVTAMRGLKRTVRKHGEVRGHQKGINSNELLDYRTARYQIYLPVYQWVLEHHLQDELAHLRKIASEQSLVLLDYETNTDIDNLEKPLSHAGLIMHYLNGEFPSVDSLE